MDSDPPKFTPNANGMLGTIKPETLKRWFYRMIVEGDSINSTALNEWGFMCRVEGGVESQDVEAVEAYCQSACTFVDRFAPDPGSKYVVRFLFQNRARLYLNCYDLMKLLEYVRQRGDTKIPTKLPSTFIKFNSSDLKRLIRIAENYGEPDRWKVIEEDVNAIAKHLGNAEQPPKGTFKVRQLYERL